MAELPQGTITFLFTDIEGSTRLLRKLGERYVTMLADHNRILRAAFEEHVGQEIDTQGDAFFVAFRRARDAVSAAASAQRALAAHEWPDGAELRVRVGMHTGEPSVTDEGYRDRGIDAKIKRSLALQANDPAAAGPLCADIDRSIVDKAPWVPTHTSKWISLVSKRVGNYQYNPQSGVLLDQLWVR